MYPTLFIWAYIFNALVFYNGEHGLDEEIDDQEEVDERIGYTNCQ